MMKPTMTWPVCLSATLNVLYPFLPNPLANVVLLAHGALLSRVARSVDPKKVASIANNMVKAQGQKATAASKKKNLNAKTQAKGETAYVGTEGKDKNTKKKERKAAGDREVTKAQKDRKTARTAKWEAQKKTPDQKAAKKAEKAKNRADRKALKPDAKPAGPTKTDSKKEKITPEEKAAAAKHLKASAVRMQNTENIPGRKDSYTVSNAKSVSSSLFYLQTVSNGYSSLD